uniref:guanosine-3',5'-bis(diphosphate) 3'-diphosphatase n=1 Tax=uncultured Thiotrichaceae bacterium TaxID=298394 RepID=A0A6S6TPI8_9GAMM|nr:MAG: GTP pyrophosphokinase (EC, (p)ppGpp synthetase II / Guanosine-3',5'-bis(diphosphate) 3'-pyrophosphohydrolase (EC [uncultured Thiotrichaceae bacterium]
MPSIPPNNFFRAADLMNMVERYLSEEESRHVYEAFILADSAHSSVLRKSGEPYITHPLEVARILAEMRMDADTLSAALLHDVIEDTDHSEADIAAHSGPIVAHMVEGVTKLATEDFANKQEATIASFQKMMTAMTDDFRVVLIKLADRLHNLRTLGFKKPASQRRIAKETLAIYVPLARRMGMHHMRRNMQLLAFQHLYPWRSKILRQSLERYLDYNREIHKDILNTVLDAVLKQVPGSLTFIWRKNPFTIYERIKRHGKRFDEKREILEIRVLVGTVDDCYRTLGIIHNLYHPKLNGFYDFISTPKTDGFQALQTTVYTPSKQAVRFQIQTRTMYHVAQYGITAQWRYPDMHSRQKAKITQDSLDVWLDQVREFGLKADNAVEFYTDMKADFFLTEIYAFTPKGDVKEFPRGATMVDYAYGIHTELGQRCVGAKIDGEEVPLRTRIPNGATIEVLTDPQATPQPSWLNHAITGKARSHIRNWLRQQKVADRLTLGRKLFDQALHDHKSSLEVINPDEMATLLQTFKMGSIDELFLAIAQGEHCSRLLSKRLLGGVALGKTPMPPAADHEATPLLVKGADGLLIHFSNCCYPLPNDPILAHLNPDVGLEVHRDSCSVLDSTVEPESVLSVAWAAQEDTGQQFLAGILTQAYNVPGVIFHVAELFEQMKVNIEEVNTKGDSNIKQTEWIVHVNDLEHLREIIRLVEHVPSVIRVKRLLPKSTESDDNNYFHD